MKDKMKKLIFILLSSFVLLIFIQACSSPMDVDTPRDKKLVPGENYKITGKTVTDIQFDENGLSKSFISKGSTFQIDTTMGKSNIWLRLNLEDMTNDAGTLNRICIQNLKINLDSVDVSKPVIFSGRNSDNNNCQLRIARGLNTQNDTTAFAGPKTGSAEMTFSLDRENGELWAYIMTKVYENRIWLEYRDSTYTDYITVTRLDTTYDSNGKMIIKEVVEKIPKEVTVTIEEEKRKQDSLFLNGKMKLKF